MSWNESWTGTTQVRQVKVDGDRLIYTTPPFRFFVDGKMSVVTLIWEKVK
ncbi:MAG: lipocalin-like domain-containing protein [Pseudomonadota bacterium]